MPLVFQELLHFQCRHAAAPSRGDRLTIAPVLDVAARIHSGNFGEDEVGGFQIAVLVGIELSFKDFCIGDMTNA